MKPAALALAAALVAGGVLLATASSSSALNCPNGTSPTTIVVPVVGRSVVACKPTPQCDPAACDPTALPPQD